MAKKLPPWLDKSAKGDKKDAPPGKGAPAGKKALPFGKGKGKGKS